MSQTVIRGTQILNNTVQRQDLDTSTLGQAVATKLVQGTGITLNSTGADAGTGDVTVSLGPHEASHVTGSDQIPLASASTKGLLNQTSGNSTDFIDGTNNSQPLQPVIWSARLRSFQALGNSTFEVDQRNVFGTLTNPASGTMICDRWSIGKAGTHTENTNTLFGQYMVIPPAGSFRISQGRFWTWLTAQQVSLGAPDYLAFHQNVEGPNWRELSADVTSISLIAYCDVALKFSLVLRSPDATRSLCKLCTIPAATWTLATMPNIPVPSGGNFSTAVGVAGYVFSICLAAGSSLTAPANDTWQNGNFIGAVGMDNFASKPVNTNFYLAFVQHEPGALCTTPIDCPFTQNYDDCLRYYQKSTPYTFKIGAAASGIYASRGWLPAGANPTGRVSAVFPKRLAKAPTITLYSATTGAANVIYVDNNTTYAVSGTTSNEAEISGVSITGSPTIAGHMLFDWQADTGW